MASIQRRTTATGERWRVLYRVDGRQVSDTFDDATAAARHKDAVERIGGKAARQLLDLRDGLAPSSSGLTLAAFLTTYIDRLDGVTEGTRRDYRSMTARKITGTMLSELPLELVTRDAVADWQRDLAAAGLSAKTRRNYHALISSALNDAVMRELIPANRAKGIRIGDDDERPGREKVFLSPGEVAVLVSATPAHYQPFVVTLVGTGLRFGEATALQVGDVNLDATPPTLTVARAWKRTGKAMKALGAPKTKAGRRTISLPPEVAETLRPLVEGRPRTALLFTTPRGTVVRSDHFHRSVWQPLVVRLNATKDDAGNAIPPLLDARPRVHDLRHTHASQLMRAGLPLNVVMTRLGHENIATTVGVYGHLAPDYLAATAAAASLGLVQAVPAIEG